MRLRRMVFLVLAGQGLAFFACSTGPSTGTSMSSGGGHGAGGGHGGGGMEAGICVHVDHYDLCGACEACLEEKCCPELTACTKTKECIPCASNDPNAVGPCEEIKERNALLQCTLKCEPCHPGFDSSPPDCGNFAMQSGGGGHGGGGSTP